MEPHHSRAETGEMFDDQSIETDIPPYGWTGLAARFDQHGSYELWGYVEDRELAGDDLVLAEPGCRALSDLELQQVHERLTLRAPSFAAAGNDEERNRVVALTHLDLNEVMVRRDEEEMLLFLRYIETGDTAPP